MDDDNEEVKRVLYVEFRGPEERCAELAEKLTEALEWVLEALDIPAMTGRVVEEDGCD